MDHPIRLSCQNNHGPRATIRVRTIRPPDEAVWHHQIKNDGIPPTGQRYDRDTSPLSQSRPNGPVQPTELGRGPANGAIWDADNAPRRHRHKRSRTDIRCPLRLPGEFFEPSKADNADSDYMAGLRETIQRLVAIAKREKEQGNTFVHPQLEQCTHVFLRCDRVAKPLTALYEGDRKSVV